MSELSIKVNIAGRTYPLTIDREEEEEIRKAAQLINANIKDLQENYAVKDMQDLLSMTALQYAVKQVGETKVVESYKLKEAFVNVEAKLNDYLNK